MLQADAEKLGLLEDVLNNDEINMMTAFLEECG